MCHGRKQGYNLIAIKEWWILLGNASIVSRMEGGITIGVNTFVVACVLVIAQQLLIPARIMNNK